MNTRFGELNQRIDRLLDGREAQSFVSIRSQHPAADERPFIGSSQPVRQTAETREAAQTDLQEEWRPASMVGGGPMRQPDPAEILTRLGGDLGMFWMQKTFSVCALLTAFLLLPATLYADGLSAVKSCETDSSPPEDIARLAILPNGESRGSDTAATLITMAKQKAKEGKDIEALQWAMLCQFDTKEQEAIRRDSAAVLQYLKQ